MKKKTKGMKSKRTTLVVLCSALTLILAVLIVGTAYMESVLGLINRGIDRGQLSESEYWDIINSQKESRPDDYSGTDIDPDDVDWGNIADPLETGNGVVNLLLVGQDRREGEGRARSDAMILCTINKHTKTLTMTSFMRDMYVQIPGYSDNRINVSYALGGCELLDECLKVNFGIEVDGNIEVDFYGCMDAIDMVGGVEIELTQAEANYLNRRGNWEVTNESGWNLKAGMNRLTGSQAVAYSRVRDVGNGDFGRTERQRKVLTALLEQSKDMSLTEIHNFLRAVLPKFTTDMTNSEILGYALAIFKLLPDLQINTIRIPADGAFRDAWIREMSVLLPDLEKNRALLSEIMAE